MTRTKVERKHRLDAMKAARELGYSEFTVEKIRTAQSEEEITRILHDARHAEFRNWCSFNDDEG